MAVLAAITAVTTVISVVDASSGSTTGGPTSSLTILVPGSAGGGYDSLARESQQAMRSNGISGNVQVVNVPGASGTIGLQTLVDMAGHDDSVLVVGSAMVGGIAVTGTNLSFGDTTPITTATTDYSVIVLPEDSPYESTEAFVDAWKADPEGHPIGGGALGNSDHLAVLALAEEVGIDPAVVNYIPYSGGGEVLAGLLSGTVAAGVSGYGEMSDQIDAGTVRGIGITSEERVKGIDMETFTEQGIPVTVPNWRGFVAPPGISAKQKAELASMFSHMFETEEWEAAVERNQWEEVQSGGSEFESFIDDQTASTESLLESVES